MNLNRITDVYLTAINESFSTLRLTVEQVTNDQNAKETRHLFEAVNTWHIKIKRKVVRVLSLCRSFNDCRFCWQKSGIRLLKHEKQPLTSLVPPGDEQDEQVDSLFMSTSQR